MIDFDFILQKVGELGTYQILLFVALLYCGVPAGLNALAPVFISYTPEYRCYMDPFDEPSFHLNVTEDYIMNITTPLDESRNPEDPCVRYGYNLTGCDVYQDFSCVNTTKELIPCEDYYYDQSLFTSSTVTEFDLVCDRRLLTSLADSMYMVGFLVGSLIFGNISDWYGRKISGLLSVVAILLAMLWTAYSSSAAIFITCRFLVATFCIGNYIIVFTYLVEMVGSRRRTLVGMVMHMSFSVGYMLWSGIAYLYRDWHQMLLAALVMSLPILPIFLVIPESARWLFTKGKIEKGKKVVSKMEKLNKTQLTPDDWKEAERCKTETSSEENKYTTLDLFRYPAIRILTIKVGISWAVNSMVYYGISLNAGALVGNIFLNNIYAGVFEIVMYALMVLIMDHVGRRLLLGITLIGSGVALLSSTILFSFIEEDDEGLAALGLALNILGRGLVASSFAVVYAFTGELYPTVIRTNGLACGSVFARIGSIISPFIIELQESVFWLPNTIFGTFAVIGGIVSLTIRDTTGIGMMETIEDAEKFHSRKGKPSLQAETSHEPQHGYENELASSDEPQEQQYHLSKL